MMRVIMMLVVCLLHTSLNYAILPTPQHYTYENYSITLPNNWRELSPQEVEQYVGQKPPVARGWALGGTVKGGAISLAGIYKIQLSEIPLEAAWDAMIDALLHSACEKKDGASLLSFRILYRGETQINGKPAKYCALTALEGNKQICVLLYFIPSGSGAYYLQFSAEVKDFYLLHTTYDEIAQSFVSLDDGIEPQGNGQEKGCSCSDDVDCDCDTDSLDDDEDADDEDDEEEDSEKKFAEKDSVHLEDEDDLDAARRKHQRASKDKKSDDHKAPKVGSEYFSMKKRY